jgi:hypothetical protein
MKSRAAVLLLLVLSSNAWAVDEQMKLLDGDAPFVMTVKPRAIWAVWTWMKGIGGQVGMFVQSGLTEASTEMKKQFGFDPTTKEGYEASGIDPDAAIVASIMAIDPTYEKSYKALAGMKGRDPKALARIPRAFWRTRIVAKVKDVAKVTAAMKAMATQGGPGYAALPDGDVAKVLGTDAKEADKLKKQLAAKKVLAIWRPDLSYGQRVVSFVRVEGTLLVIDIFAGWSDVELDWKRDGKEIVKQLGRKQKGANALLSRGAGTQVAAADAALWVEPSRILDMTKATGRENIVRALASAQDPKSLRDEGDKEVAQCELFRDVATKGQFEDFAWTFKADGKAFELSGVWGVRAGAQLPGALTTADDGLLDVATSKDALAVGVLFTTGLKPLRALPRPGVMAKDLKTVDEAVRLCGFGGGIVAMVFGWPQYASLVMESAPKDAQAVLDQARNVAFAFKTFGMQSADNIGVVLASAEGAAAPAIELAMSAQVGSKGSRKVGSKTVDVWKPKSPSDPMGVRSPLPGGRLAAGLALGKEKAVDWFYGRASPKAAPGQTPILAAGRLDMQKTLDLFAKADPYAGKMAADVAKKLGALSGVLRLSGSTLVGTLRLEIK